MERFRELDAQVLGISTDHTWANKAFADKLKLTFPLLSDFKREVSKAYGVFSDELGAARRTTFVIDKSGIVRHIEQGNVAIDPSGAASMCELIRKGSSGQKNENK